MQDQYVSFMEKIFTNGHAEVAQPLDQVKECWYLLSFRLYHPQKPIQIRVVFDSSAQYSRVSLNNMFSQVLTLITPSLVFSYASGRRDTILADI